MKTAIIKTGLWQDDSVSELDTDTKLLYLCLLTNPQRDLLQAFRCGDVMLSAYTGFTKQQIAECREELIKTGRIIYEEGYYIFTRQDFVRPSAGRDSAKIYEREYNKLPETIKRILNNVDKNTHEINPLECTCGSTCTSTCGSTGDIDIDIDIDIDKYIEPIVQKKYSEDDERLTNLLFDLMKENYPHINRAPKEKDFQAMNLLYRKDGRDYPSIETVIRWSQQDSFWRQNILSVSTLRRQFDKLAIRVIDFKQNNTSVEI
jgi:hypothetical protein